MLSGYRSIVVAAFGCLALAAWGLADSQRRYQQTIAGHQTVSQNKRHPQQSDTEHAGVPAFVERFISNPEPEEKTAEKERRDLAAQENTATWAFWVVLLSFGQLMLSGFGLWALINTFRQTERSLELNRQTFEIENRPIMVPVGIEFTETENSVVAFAMVWKNIGKLPADVRLAASRRVGDNERRTLKECYGRPVGQGMTSAVHIVAAGDTVLSDPHFALIEPLKRGVGSYHEIAYRSAIGDGKTQWDTRAHGDLGVSGTLGELEEVETVLPGGNVVKGKMPKVNITGYVFRKHGDWFKMT